MIKNSTSQRMILNNIIETNDENITDEPNLLLNCDRIFAISQVDVYNNQNNETGIYSDG